MKLKFDEEPKEWWYEAFGAPVGPVELGQLRQRIAQGHIKGATLVWKTGTEAWLPVETTVELAYMFPPPLPAPEPAEPPKPTSPPPLPTGNPVAKTEHVAAKQAPIEIPVPRVAVAPTPPVAAVATSAPIAASTSANPNVTPTDAPAKGFPWGVVWIALAILGSLFGAAGGRVLGHALAHIDPVFGLIGLGVLLWLVFKK